MTDRYADFESAGQTLAAALLRHRRSNSVVLAIANSGVPVAIPVADGLECPLDLLLIRRLFVHDGRSLPVCAVSIGGNIVLDSESRALSSTEEQFKQQAIAELSTRTDLLRSNAPSKNLRDSNVIVVDNGIHTGSTFKIAINALRKLQPHSITVGVPIADSSTQEPIEALADEVVCLKWSENFGNTALWYTRFNRPSDEEVRSMLSKRWGN